MALLAIVIAQIDNIRGSFFNESIEYGQTQGKISKSTFNFHPASGGGSGYRINIQYEYQVGRKEYTAHKVNFSASSFRNPEGAKALCEKYPKGMSVIVYYDKNAPGFAVLEPEVDGRDNFTITLIVFLLFIFALVIFLIVNLRNKVAKRISVKKVKSKKKRRKK